MKILMLFAMAAALLTAQDHSAQTAPARAAKPADSAAPGLPAGATEVQPNLYRYTDAKGKTWMYKRTPFGFSKWEDKPEPASQPVQNNNSPLVVDLGDSYRFEERTPFGISKWTRKKAELTDDEKAFVATAQEKQDKQKSAASDHAEEKK